jgi:peptidyl-prolyl cis-trans isomerase A (cyclophilin A)
MRQLYLLGFVLSAVVATTVAAPQSTGAIAGTITFDDGAPAGGVTVSIARDAWFRQIVSVHGGLFRVPDVPAGNYTVWYSLPGFITAVQQHITVTDGSEVALKATLSQAPIVETVTVISHPQAVSLERSKEAVVLATTFGIVMISLDPIRAPVTTANFLKYVNSGFYTNGRFHRVTREDNYAVSLPNRPMMEIIQGGINPERRPQAFPPIPLERTNVTGIKHVAGVVSMARGTAADTATSDFFILLNDQPSLDFGGKRFDDQQGAAAFGHVVSGMDVVRKIQQQPTEGQNLKPPITILSAQRVNP